jgi:hypothetical protein
MIQSVVDLINGYGSPELLTRISSHSPHFCYSTSGKAQGMACVCVPAAFKNELIVHYGVLV